MDACEDGGDDTNCIEQRFHLLIKKKDEDEAGSEGGDQVDYADGCDKDGGQVGWLCRGVFGRGQRSGAREVEEEEEQSEPCCWVRIQLSHKILGSARWAYMIVKHDHATPTFGRAS